MTTSTIVLFILLAYVSGMFIISKFARRRMQSFQDTISAKGQTTVLLLAGSAIGGQIGSGFVIGGAEYGALYGVGGAWYGIGCGVAYFVVACMCRFVYRNKFISLSDYFAQRYQGKACRLIYSMATLCCCVSLLAGQLLAGRAVFLTLGLSAVWGVVLTAVVALVYANAAGLWGSMAVSTVQTAIISLGAITALIAMVCNPGLGFLTQSLPPASFVPVPFGGEFFIATLAPIVLAAPVVQMSFQTICSAKSEKTALYGYLLAGTFLIPVALIPPVLGMFGRAIFPALAAEKVFTALLLNRLPTVVAAIILAAVVCAVITSCNSAYIASATIFVHDIYQGMVKPDASGKACKRLMLLVNVVVCVLGVFLALRMNDIIRLLSMGYGLLSSGCLVPFFGGMAWKRGNEKGALCSAAVGMSASLASSLELIYLPYASISCVALAAAAYVVGSLMTSTTKTAQV